MTTLRARLALLIALAGSFGCTLVSGWNDLQDGTRATPDASLPASRDAGADSAGGAQDSSAAHDSSGEDSGSAVIVTVACGSMRCPVGVGCCVAILGQSSTCQASSQSCGPPSTFESCSDSSQCTASLGHSSQCCASSTTGLPSVSCRTTCAGGDAVVCDPTLESPGCPAGMTCQPSTDGFGYNTCQ